MSDSDEEKDGSSAAGVNVRAPPAAPPGAVGTTEPASELQQVLALLRTVEQNQQTLRRQLRVVESKVSGGFLVMGKRMSGLENSLVAITSAATAGLLGGSGPRSNAPVPARAAPPPPPAPGAPPPEDGAAPPPAALGDPLPPPPHAASGAVPHVVDIVPPVPPPPPSRAAPVAGAGNGASPAAARRSSMAVQSLRKKPTLENKLRGVVRRKSVVAGKQSRRRSSMTAFALGKISEGEISSVAGSPHRARTSTGLDSVIEPEDEDDEDDDDDGGVDLSGPKAKIWTGSWNVGAKEPFSGTQTGREYDITKWAPPGYDVYVVAIQEGISDRVYEAFAAATGTSRLNAPSGAGEVRQDKVLGRGDGSFRRQKFTGIAAFVRPGASSFVKFLKVARHSFGVSEGSKGGVGLLLKIHSATVAFVGVHMASKKQALRFQQYKELVKELGGGLGNEFFQLTEQFHHVIFMGDTNYRCDGLSTEEAMLYIGQRQHMTMLQLHDGLNEQKRTKMVFHNFEEPVMAPDFFPTYKKIEERMPADYTRHGWTNQVYRVNYKEHFYKGGGVRDRLPSWCDRIQFHSLRDLAGQLSVDSTEAKVDGLLTKVSSYRSMNDILTISDHSPVCCGFTLRQPKPTHTEADSEVPVRVMLRVYDVEVEDNAQMVLPKVVKIMFPAPHETDTGVSPPARVQREKGATEMAATISWDATCAAQMPRLHLLIKAQTDKKHKGHCVVSMQDLVASLDDEGCASHTFFEPMCCDGVPRSSTDGRQLHIQFSISMKMVASPVESLRDRRRNLNAGGY